MALNLVLHIALTSELDFWHGDWSWAARYHLTSVDLLMIPLLPYLVETALRNASLLSWTVRACIVAGLFVQALAVSMPISAETAVEFLALDPTCHSDSWDTQQAFRIGNRLRNLYCLTTDARKGLCADPPVVAQARARPLCADTLHQVQLGQRLAFFPFDPHTGGSTVQIALWMTVLLAAIFLTARWGRSWLSELRADRAKALPEVFRHDANTVS
jgi:hypothetical protein